MVKLLFNKNPTCSYQEVKNLKLARWAWDALHRVAMSDLSEGCKKDEVHCGIGVGNAASFALDGSVPEARLRIGILRNRIMGNFPLIYTVYGGFYGYGAPSTFKTADNPDCRDVELEASSVPEEQPSIQDPNYC